MSITIKVNGVSNSLVHKGSDGLSAATLPDVCKTPSAGGPVPLPYPNVSRSATLAKGTKTVKADGGMMIANKGSEFAVSTGDEPGTLGGVKSGTFMKESTWISYSFDVKIEGQGACRLGDKKFQNHENTVDLAGVVQIPIFQPPSGPDSDPKCAKLYEEIFRLLFGQPPKIQGPGFPQGTKGLAFRWEEYATNRGNWSPERAKTHLEEYKKQQDVLNKKLVQWRNKNKRNCDDKDLPPGTKEYAAQVPELGPGKPVVPAPLPASAFSVEDLATALGVSTGVVIGILAISRLIRLFPPLLPLQTSPI